MTSVTTEKLMRKPCFLYCRPLFTLTAACAIALTTAASSRAESIDFESFNGPSLFGNSLQPLNILTSLGTVHITGGTILTAENNLPADTSSVYGSVQTSEGDFPYLNPITITFPEPVVGFSVDIFNGNTSPADFMVSDNAGHSQTFTLPDNFSGGDSLVSIPASGNVIRIFATPLAGDTPWDFSIDNIAFNETPEPSTLTLYGVTLLLGSFVVKKSSIGKRTAERLQEHQS